MQIFIPTRDRLDAQFTWDNLPPSLQACTVLVCPAEEVSSHTERSRLAVARPPVRLAAVRQWIIEGLADNSQPVIMLDDDLSFFVRRTPAAYNLKPADPVETENLFVRLNDLVAGHPGPENRPKYAHAGLSPRQMNNQHFPDMQKNTMRVNAVHCVDPMVLCRENIRYDDVNMMEDYHVTLSLFEKGYDNCVIVDAAWDQNRGSGAPGGFSHYRNQETQKEAAETLASLHPDVVKVVEKEPKTGSGGFAGKRTDVRVQWLKAFKNART